MLLAAGLVLLITSPLYWRYANKILYRLDNSNAYSISAAKKIHPNHDYFDDGFQAEHLTFREYQAIDSMMRFHEAPSSATEISFIYGSEFMLPDFLLKVSYHLPIGENVDTVQKADFQSRESLKVQFRDSFQLVTYEAGAS